jgi:multiple sugar transport system substrate-binding protein
VLAACGDTGSTNADSDIAADTTEDDPDGTAAGEGLNRSLIEGQDVTISMWQHSYPPLNDWTQKQIDAFTEENPNISVEFEVVPFEEYNQNILIALAGGQAPNLFEADDYTIAQFIQDEVIAPVDPGLFGFDSVDDMGDNYEGASLDLVKRDEQLYGVPYDWEAPVLGYNISLLEEHGIDPDSLDTWSVAMEAAAQISETDDSGNLTTSGLSFVHGIDSYYQLQGTTLLNQAGASLLNDDQTAAAINSPEAQQVFELWRDAIHEYEASAPGFTSTFYTTEFGEGRVGMGYMLVWANSILAPADYQYGEEFEIVRLPTFQDGATTSKSYAWNWTLNAQNTDEELVAAHMLMDHLSQQGASFLLEAGLINPRQGWRGQLSEQQLDPYTEIFESLEDSEPVDPHPAFNELWAPVIDVFTTVETNPDADIPALLEHAESEINAVLEAS